MSSWRHPGGDPDPDPDATSETAAPSLAASRSRRGPSSKKRGREEALARLKSGGRYQVSEEMEDGVFDEVGESEYAQKVEDRLRDGFIVDDDGEYADDGREIFEQEQDEDEQDRSGPRKKAKTKAKEEKKKRGNIKNMLLNMPSSSASAKKASEATSGIDGDEVLESLLGEIKSVSSNKVSLKKPKSVVRPVEREARLSKVVLAPARSGLTRPKAERPSQVIEEVDSMDVSEAIVKEEEEEAEEEIEEEMGDEEEVKVEVKTEAEELDTQDFASLFASEDPFGEDMKEVKKEEPSADFSSRLGEQVSLKAPASKLDSLPLTTDAQGNKVLRMFWLDAFEDPFKHPGTVWLFGKVQSGADVLSCCVTVKNIPRRVFLLKRSHRYDLKAKEETDAEVTADDVRQEFVDRVKARYKIGDFRSRACQKGYAFELTDVPDRAEYLEIQYPPKFQALPSDLRGETFSRVFGANQSSLEHLLLSRKMRGPGWIDLSGAAPSPSPVSHCRVEAVVEAPSQLKVLPTGEAPPPPPLTVMALNMRTVVNPRSMLNEVVLVSALVHDEFRLDRPAPERPFKSHFCALAKPDGACWPFDFQKMLDAHKRRGNAGPRIEKMDSERTLLGFVLAQIHRVDPDIIVGHDLSKFDLEVLVHRAVACKIPRWSRIGRLNRTQPPNFKANHARGSGFAERQAMAGRLVCDLKISAKELIRCKSYELAALAEKLLGDKRRGSASSADDSVTSGPDEVAAAFDKSTTLMAVVKDSVTDAADTLQCIYELNALPLAYQITQIAGNVMSRTLLGGRAERNEFLLLHAFTERDYICPDKQYGKANKKESKEDDEDHDKTATPAAAQGRRKPAYTGGLVLEPKRGFYDKYILLMDFNSLYPSIIQEYNICFTTVSRKRPALVVGDADEFIPELPAPESAAGVLPTEIRKLVDSRKQVKQVLKESGLSEERRMQLNLRQMALKLTANSMYGCLGFAHSRFFARPLAALVTSRGREILLNTKSLVERKMNLEVIYGDTDSIMINTNSVDYQGAFDLGHKIKQEVNSLYKLLELDIDGVFKFMLLLKKKKYAAVTVEMKNGQEVLNTELKGLDVVRRDWSQLASDAGKTILSRILSECGADERVSFVHQHLESLRGRLERGEVPLAELAVTKQLTKDPESYPEKKSLPHVQVALRVNSKGGKKLRAGDTVEYVICDDGSGLPATQRAYHVDEVRERREKAGAADEKDQLKVDIRYYLAQQLHPVVSRLCDPLDGTDASRLALCLGLDPNDYRSASNSSAQQQQQESALRWDEDRFRDCEKLKFACACGEEMTVDSAVRGIKTEEKALSLAKCANPKCDRDAPIRSLAELKNQLTLAMRRHVRRFYAAYLDCEDPACEGRTRQLPLQFFSGYPGCPTCHKAVLTKEFSEKQLYTQLLFYQVLFDVQKASAKHGVNFANSLSTVRDGLSNYVSLKQHVDRWMSANNYSMVDMTRLFSAFAAAANDAANPATAFRIRHSRAATQQ